MSYYNATSVVSTNIHQLPHNTSSKQSRIQFLEIVFFSIKYTPPSAVACNCTYSSADKNIKHNPEEEHILLSLTQHNVFDLHSLGGVL